jgi:hypothetical protein
MNDDFIMFYLKQKEDMETDQAEKKTEEQTQENKDGEKSEDKKDEVCHTHFLPFLCTVY